MFWDSIRYNLTHLPDFSGREARSRFWPYAGIVLVLAVIGIIMVMVPELNASIAKMQHFAVEHPEQVTETVGPGSYSISVQGNHPELLPDIGRMLARMELVLLATILLLGAAVTRRLHDTGRSGWWALLPFPFGVFSGIMMPKVIAALGGPSTDFGLFFAVFASNLLWNVTLIGLLVFLGFRSKAGTNRFGDQPG